jgi:protein ImuB
MLWLCIHLPALPLEALTPPADQPAGIVETSGARRRVIALNEAAHRRGLSAGTPVNSALGLIPEIRLLQRDIAAELQGLEAIACWAYNLGMPVTIAADTLDVRVEIQRSLRLFGGWAALRQHIAAQAADLPYTCRYGIAPTLAAAALQAHAGAGLQHPIARSGEIHAAIRNWPLQLLPFEQSVIETLLGSGLRRIGEVLALPGDALGRRFGPEVPLALARLLGRAGEAWKSFEPPPIYRRRFELPGSAETIEALLFPLRKMLHDFALYLRGRDVAVQSFRLSFRDLGRHQTKLEIGLLAPTRDPQRLLLVLRDRLEKISLQEPVQELRLEARRFEPASAVQDDLFQSGSMLTEGFDTLQERLVARLGENAVRKLAVTPDHRPERAWCLSSTKEQSPATDSCTAHPPRPLWLLSQVKPIPAPRLLGPPERIECGWWEGRHEIRDYHLAEDESGRKLWAYREPGKSQWQVHGLWQ